MTATLVSYDDAVARYEPVIGLETHVELGTVTKMFCGCPTVFGAEPNSAVCPVCLGLPGSLPVANRAAIEYTIRIGLALNCSIATWCRFARKNYFYPDMPKDFQISQYDEPLCTDGWLDVDGRGPAVPDRHRARAPGGGHRQVAARGRGHRPDPRRGLLAGRLQPGRHPAGRGGHQAGARHRRAGPRGGPGLRHRAARAAARAGRLRRPDGRGLAALRREHLDRARRGAVGHPDRDQERQLAALGRARRPVRDPAPGRRARRRRPDRAGDPALPGGQRAPRRPAGARKRRRTTATSPSPTWCRWPRRGSGSRSCGPRCPSCPPPAAPGCRPTGACPTWT